MLSSQYRIQYVVLTLASLLLHSVPHATLGDHIPIFTPSMVPSSGNAPLQCPEWVRALHFLVRSRMHALQ